MEQDDTAEAWLLRFRSRHGRGLRVRTLHSEDAGMLVELFAHLSPRTRYLRFFSPLTHLSMAEVARYAEQLARIDPFREEALLAFADAEEPPVPVAVARLAQRPTQPSVAEVAIVVRDDYQGEGVGRTLFNLLIERARTRGITTIAAVTVAENAVVLAGLRSCGLPFRTHTQQGETSIEVFLVEKPIADSREL